MALRRAGEKKYEKDPRVEPTLVFRETASNTNERTCIAAVLPAQSAGAHTLTGVLGGRVEAQGAAVVFNSFCFDYALRLRTAGTHVSFTYILPMPVPHVEVVNGLPVIETRQAWQIGIEHVSEDKALWPALWEANRAVAEAYSLTPDDFEHILSTFPVFARKRPAFFAYLKERVEEWKREASRRKTTPAIRAVPASHVQPVTAHPVMQSRSATVSKPVLRKATSQFQQAAILAWVVHQMYKPSRPVSRFRAGKMIYLIERAVQLGLFQNYLKQAAGPYDPSLRYKGPEDIAVRQQRWITPVDESHFEPGPKVNVALRYARRYLNLAQASAVIEQFKAYQDGTLSRWTTVDMAARELHNCGESVTPQCILKYLVDLPEWQHKLRREEFSFDLIASTLAGLRKLGFLADS